MRTQCAVTNEEFEISPAEQNYCEQNGLPLPRKCPTERLREMAIFLNMFHLYRTECAFTGKSILSWIPPEAGWRVAAIDAWEKDDWDELAYGRDFDFKRPFFEQFHELVKEAPIYSLSVVYASLENSEYTNCITGAKNSYLCFASSEIEDCLYTSFSWRSKNLVDCTYSFDSELCYDCFDIRNCYQLKHSNNCIGCSDSTLLQSCSNCQYCYGCVNLANQQYHLFNERLSKADYLAAIAAIDLSDRRILHAEKEKFLEFAEHFPKRAVISKNIENCTGNYVFNSKNCNDANFVSEGENIESGMFVQGGKNSFVWGYYGNGGELIYNCSSAGDGAYNTRFCHDVFVGVSNLEYCTFCGYGTKDCFGSSALKRRQYCIFNKQYTKDDYFQLRARIVEHMKQTGEWGKFFPPSISPHSYNRSGADFFFPLSKDEAAQRGWRWDDEMGETFPVGNVLTPPMKIDDFAPEDLEKTYACAETKKSFKILKPELEFYRRLRIPPSAIAPLHRMRLSARQLQVRKLEAATCRNCATETMTVHNSEEQIVYCEKCFAELVY